MQPKHHNTISPDQFEGSVFVSNPTITDRELKPILQKWISKQGKHWPSVLTADALNRNLTLIYLPFWRVFGEGSAQWTASIGVDRQEPAQCGACSGRGWIRYVGGNQRRCTDCAGTGQVLRTKKLYSMQSGLVRGEAHEIVKNFDDSGMQLRCGERKFDANNISQMNADAANAYSVMAPLSTQSEAGKQAAIRAIGTAVRHSAQKIASGIGSVRDLQIGNIQPTRTSAETWLYPVYLGMYDAGGEQIPIQIDGLTQNIWADVPGDVKALRRTDRNRWIAIGVAALALLAFLYLMVDFLVMGFHPCGTLDNLIGNPSGCEVALNPSDIYGWQDALFSPSGNVIALRNNFGSTSYVELRQRSDGRLLHTLVGGMSSQSLGMAFSTDGSMLAMGDNVAVTLWRVGDGKKMQTFSSGESSAGKPNFAWAIAFSPDGKTLAVGYEDSSIKLWQVSSGRLIDTLRGHNDEVRSVAISGDGNTIASGDSDGILCLWQASNGRLLNTLEGHTAWISEIAFLPGNKELISASGDETLRLWNRSSGELVKTIQLDFNSNQWISQLELSPDGTIAALVIYGSANRSRVELWQMDKERLTQSIGLGMPKSYLDLRETGNAIIGIDYPSDDEVVLFQKQDVGSRATISVDRFFSPGELFPTIAIRKIRP